MRAIIYRPHEGNWHCKGLGTADWSKSEDNVIVNNGQLCDQPFIANILGDGDRACVYRRSDGNIYVKSKGRYNWGDNKGTFSMFSTPNMTIQMVFPASGGDASHDEVFIFTPTTATLAKGHIHPVVYRGSEQQFYVQKQSGIRMFRYNAVKFWKAFNGNYGTYTCNQLSKTDLADAKTKIRKQGLFTFQYGAVYDEFPQPHLHPCLYLTLILSPHMMMTSFLFSLSVTCFLPSLFVVSHHVIFHLFFVAW